MKTSILFGAIFVCVLSAPTTAAQQEPAPGIQAVNMDIDKQMNQMQENMEKMQQLLDKLRATTDTGERQKLIQEHMQTMQENMRAMRGMGGPMMGGQKGGAMMKGDPNHRQDMLEKRMDMMQMMMDQMMRLNQMMGSIPTQ